MESHIHRLEDSVLLRCQFYPIRIAAGRFFKDLQADSTVYL